MNYIKILLIIPLLVGLFGCTAMYYAGYVPGVIDVGTPALPYITASTTTLEMLNEELITAGAAVTLEDTYNAAYGQTFKGLAPDGDTGQAFKDMEKATLYFQNILKSKGVSDANRYLLTGIDTKNKSEFTLIAAVYRPKEVITILNKYNINELKTLTCMDRPYYKPYQSNCNGKSLDIVYEWAAVPNDCFTEQGHQAILLTLTANKVLERKAKEDFWKAEKKWLAGEIEEVVIAQDYLVCQTLGIEEGYATSGSVSFN